MKSIKVHLRCVSLSCLLFLLLGCNPEPTDAPGTRFETFDTNGIYSVMADDESFMFVMDKAKASLSKVDTMSGEITVVANGTVGKGPSLANAVSFDYNAVHNRIIFLAEDDNELAELIALNPDTGDREIIHQFSSQHKLIGYISTPPVTFAQGNPEGEPIIYVLLEASDVGAFQILEVNGENVSVIFNHLDLPFEGADFCLPLAFGADPSTGSLFVSHVPCSNVFHAVTHIDIETGTTVEVARRSLIGDPLWVASSTLYDALSDSLYMLSPNGRTVYQADFASKQITTVVELEVKETHRGGSLEIREGQPVVFDAYEWRFYSVTKEGVWAPDEQLSIANP